MPQRTVLTQRISKVYRAEASNTANKVISADLANSGPVGVREEGLTFRPNLPHICDVLSYWAVRMLQLLAGGSLGELLIFTLYVRPSTIRSRS